MLRPRFLVGPGLAIAILAGPASAQQPAPTYDAAPGIAALLATVQSPHGVLRARAEPRPAAPLHEDVLVAFALTSVAASSHYKALGPDAVKHVAVLCARLTDGSEEPPSAEDQVLLRMLFWYLPSMPGVERDLLERCEGAAKGARTSFRLRDERSAAAKLLVRRLDGEDVKIDDLLAAVWPKDVAHDPMHTWFGVYAAALAPRERRDGLLTSLGAVVAARTATDADDPGTWSPAGGFDRITTTALNTMVLATANGALTPAPRLKK